MGIKIKLVKSPSSASAQQVATVKGLGIWKFGSERLLKDTPAIANEIEAKIREAVGVAGGMPLDAEAAQAD